MKNMLTPEYQLILDCLSKVLFNKDVSLDVTDLDLKRVFDEAKKQSVFSMVYYGLKNHIPERYLRKLDFYNIIILSNNAIVQCEHEELHKAMEHIPYVVLKGMASARYYREPGLRTMGDVDFLIKEEDIEKVERIITGLGFKKKDNKEHGAHIAFHRYPNSVWEMHWSMSGIPTGKNGDPVRKYFFDTIADSQLVEVSNSKYVAPDDFHHGLILLIHNARHMINTGIGLRHICDWAVFVDSVYDFDVVFKDKLTECGLYRFAQILTLLSSKYLGLREQFWAQGAVDDSVLENLILDIFDGGNFGVKNETRINQAKLITDSNSGSVNGRSKFVQLFKTLSEKSKAAMPVCKKCPLLLPVAWIYVSIRHMWRIMSGKRNRIKVKTTITGAKTRSEIYKEFRLFEK